MKAVQELCVSCHTPCDPNGLYCPSCGYILPHAMPVLNEKTVSFNDTSGSADSLQWGTAYFHPRALLFLCIDGDVLVPVPLTAGSSVLGRSTTNNTVDVDFTPFNAGGLGVSRRHARIDRVRDALQIVDLESSNGTLLNRQRLAPGVPRILRNRAVLQLGRLTVRVQFS